VLGQLQGGCSAGLTSWAREADEKIASAMQPSAA
jgi:hypothetical protein